MLSIARAQGIIGEADLDKKYFGTDGIRGTVGQYPISPEFMLKLGWATGKVLASEGKGRVLIGKDTRISGYMFESALEAGLSAAGVDIGLLGPMPTPGIAYLTRTMRAHAGIVISASHNPFEDNGIKFFSAAGTKLDDPVELAIEAALAKEMEVASPGSLGKASRVPDAQGRYIEFCKSTIPLGQSLEGIKLVLDCANGATYQIAPEVFSELGAEVISIAVEPNGLNINDGCGSTQPKRLQKRVTAEGADLGIALDGDGDRVIMVDHRGELVDGDELLFIIACARFHSKALSGPVVGTLMSNLGLENGLRERGIGFERARVGDRYVLELLNKHNGVLGGESSGHIICLDRTTTGDGVVSALQVLQTMVETGKSLGDLCSGMSKYPQHMINVQLGEAINVLAAAAVKDAVSAAESRLGDRGRVLLRPSGTEPVVRVMVEGQDEAEVIELCQEIALVVEGCVQKNET